MKFSNLFLGWTHVTRRQMCSLREVMRILPQPVVVVTSAMADATLGAVRKGVTCSSFNSLTLEPPTVLISIYHGNIINSVIDRSQQFAINILSDKQLKEGMHFAKSLSSDLSHDQFDGLIYTDGLRGLPLLGHSIGTLQCQVTNLDVVGDHKVWYGSVTDSLTNEDTTLNPMLYYQRSFRSIGDEIFMQAFEDTSMPFEDWTHEAHIRMAWNYIIKHGKENATPLIKNGIMKYNERNKDRITHGYSETVTMFYIHVIATAIGTLPEQHTFDEFTRSNMEMTNSAYVTRYYSSNVLSDPNSKHTFIIPDKLPLPS